MRSDFAGDAANSYSRFRRDLPAEQAGLLAGVLELRPSDAVIDLGCGTGQLGVPLLRFARVVVGVDPEPDMLVALGARGTSVVPVLGGDALLPLLGAALGDVGAVVIGNALHWMDEPAALARAVGVLRPGGAVAIVTQGPPLWLGSSRWQVAVKRAMEVERGPLTATCGTDDATLAGRAHILTGLGLVVAQRRWVAEHSVDAEWVVGHLRSATGGRAPSGATVAAIDDAVRSGAVERVTTTVVSGILIN